MKRRLTLSAREQTLTLAAVVVIGVGVAVSSIGWPLVDRLSRLHARTDTALEKVQRLQTLANRLPFLEQRYQAYTSLHSEESEEVLQVAFLDEVERLAKAEHLLVTLTLRPPRHEGRVVRLGAELDVEATQEGFLAFLDQVFQSPTLIQLESLRMSAGASPERPLRANLTLTKVVFRPHRGS